ncbi:MAG TPA: c-type cytochrome [Thermoanaerobaculia bacterium]|nr:c-type cytochrome [Thermoanaerobaculia bacterium]
MKKVALFVAACVLLLPFSAFADEALFKAKCVSCHGADGKKNVKKDLTSDAVQKLSDDELVKFLTTNAIHKSKVNADDAKSLVKYIRTLKK